VIDTDRNGRNAIVVGDGPLAADLADGLGSRGYRVAPLAVRESRAIMLAATDAEDAVGWKLSGDGMMKMFATEDFGEGLNAFIEKRAPNWQGK